MITSIGYQRSSFTALIQNCDHTVGIKPDVVVMNNEASENCCFISDKVKPIFTSYVFATANRPCDSGAV